MECFICGSAGEFDAIYNQEMVKVCRVCSEKAGIPVIKRPSQAQLEAMEKPFSVSDRLARLSGVKPKIAAVTSSPVKDYTRFIEKARPEELKKLSLIENFNWHLTRARRARGLTIKQLALSISESEHAILQLEQGLLPSNALTIIEKAEKFLKIPLRNKEGKKQQTIKILGNKESLIGKEIEIEDSED